MNVIDLKTRTQQARFVRNAMREEGMTVAELADKAGLSWVTVARFADLTRGNKLTMTRWPRLETCQRLLNALGYEIVGKKVRAPKGYVSV